MRRSLSRVSAALGFLGSLGFLAVGCAADDRQFETTPAALVAVCVSPDVTPEPTDWICGQPRVVECHSHLGAYVETIVVQPQPGQVCDGPTVSFEGPFLRGDHTIVVTDADVEVCQSVLTVEDTIPPVVESIHSELWPPNHTMATYVPNDCVAAFDACDIAPYVEFTWATSDEPVEDSGDGNTDPDIILTAESVQLRAERQGGSDGRIYTLGYRATDAAGHVVDGQCTVTVPHDQSGDVALDSGAVYTISP